LGECTLLKWWHVCFERIKL